jgi:SAM-dependent methyltransferase
MTQEPSFWEDPERVEEFAARDPDHRLQKLVNEYPDAENTCVLDLGCAGGRNAEFLAKLGFEVWAVDSSHAMVERTRARLRPLLGEMTTAERVMVKRMEDLSNFEDSSFALVVALGIYHSATSREEWDRALAESTRVLAPGGRLLVSVFTPECDLTGEGITPVRGEAHVFEGFPAGRVFLVDAPILDTELERHGLVPLTETETVRKPLEAGQRVSANGLYIKRVG